MSGSATLYSGFPVTIQASNAFGGNQGTGRANHYHKLLIRNRTNLNWWGTDSSASQCFGANNSLRAYGATLPGTFGNAGAGTERLAGFRGVDAAGFKGFDIYKEHTLQFRVDAYNVGNISSYDNPGRTVTAATDAAWYRAPFATASDSVRVQIPLLNVNCFSRAAGDDSAALRFLQELQMQSLTRRKLLSSAAVLPQPQFIRQALGQTVRNRSAFDRFGTEYWPIEPGAIYHRRNRAHSGAHV